MHIFLGDEAWDNQYCNGITIHHNIFYNDSGGDGSYNCIVFKGTNLGGTFTTKIENNTFNLRAQGQVFYLADSPSPGCCNNLTNGFFRNNLIYDSDFGDVTFYTHVNNLYYLGGSPTETGKVTTNPLFTNLGSNIYTLQAGSPAVGAGTNLSYTIDYAGTSVSNPPEMGAFER